MLNLAEAGALVPNFQKGLGFWLPDFLELSLNTPKKASQLLGAAP